MPKYSKFMQPAFANNLFKHGCKLEDHSSFGHLLSRGHDYDFEPIRKPEPTDAAPGSLEKLEVLARRLMRGEELYHEDDETVLATVEASTAMRDLVVGNDKRRRLANKKRRAKANARTQVQR
jgi:hypothetical protein